MTEPADDIIGEIGRLLDDVRPSPEFVSRVRQGVDARARWAWLRLDWRNVLATGAVVGSAAALLVMARVHPTVVPDRNAQPPRAAASQPSEPTQVVAQARQEEQSTRQAPVVAAREAARIDPIVSTVNGHDVIAPADERLALIRLLSRVRAGYGTVPANIVPAYDIDGLLLPPPPVVIAPLPELAPVEPGADLGLISKFIPRDKR